MSDIFRWIEALASCALEGNQWAEETLALRKTKPKEFMRRLTELEEVADV